VNRFWQLKEKTRVNEETMKIDMYHTRFESIQNPLDEGWYDSNYFESIQSKSERFYDTIHAIINQWLDSKDQKTSFDGINEVNWNTGKA